MSQHPIAASNAVNWFELPVTDTARAKQFYETILSMEMETRYMEETAEELTFFPFEPGVIRATSGKVSGALVKGAHSTPSAAGTLVYLNANPAIQPVLDRITAAGGRILVPKTKIMAGYTAVFLDTEGNRVGLHAME